MPEFDSPLENVRVASPCSANWNAMQGDDRRRYCSGCKLNVYNLSGMTRYDAEHLLRLSEGRLCVRYYLRSDGTILTKDCPVGWALIKQHVTVWTAAAFSLLVSILAGFFIVSLFKKTYPQQEPLMGAIAISRPTPTPKLADVMGEIANPIPAPPQQKKAAREQSRVRRRLPVYNAPS